MLVGIERPVQSSAGPLRCPYPECPPTARFQEETDRSRMLDLACGTGVFARPMARTAGMVVGFDLSWPMLNRAQRLAHQHECLFLVDEDRREFLGRAYFDGPAGTVALRVQTAAKRALDGARNACEEARRSGVHGAPTSHADAMTRIRSAIKEQLERDAPE